MIEEALPKRRPAREGKTAPASWLVTGTAVLGATFMGCAFTGSIALGQIAAGEPIVPVPIPALRSPAAVALGRRLFDDPSLSGDGTTSCASCHSFDHALADGRRVSAGRPGHPGQMNTPTLFNVGLNGLLNWRGDVLTLTRHTEGVIEKPTTMGAEWDQVVQRLSQDPALPRAFAEVYPDGLNKTNVVSSLVEYLNSLNTPDAPFDRFLKGDQTAMGPQARIGYRLFKATGCTSCHQGVNVGGNLKQTVGIFDTPGRGKSRDFSLGEDALRVPSLRNVGQTAPYFHDGSAATLAEAIDVMARRQVGRTLSSDEIEAIEAFLLALTRRL